MLGLFAAQLAESGLAELGHLSEQQSAQARIGVGIVFLLAVWVAQGLSGIHHQRARRLRTPWSKLAAEEHV